MSTRLLLKRLTAMGISVTPRLLGGFGLSSGLVSPLSLTPGVAAAAKSTLAVGMTTAPAFVYPAKYIKSKLFAREYRTTSGVPPAGGKSTTALACWNPSPTWMMDQFKEPLLICCVEPLSWLPEK